MIGAKQCGTGKTTLVVDCTHAEVEAKTFGLGDVVRVTHPTGGVRITDRFVVSDPLDLEGFVCIVPKAGDAYESLKLHETKGTRPMRFYPSSLTKV